MEYLWYHAGTRHWRQEGEDWLCAYKSKHDKATHIVFYEDTHHFCKELYIETSAGQIIHRLEGPGPFEVPLPETSDCWLFSRFHFFAYRRNPGHGAEVYSVRCAEIHGEEGPETIPMYIGSPPESRVPPRIVGVDEVKRRFTNKTHARPELCKGDNKHTPFHLRDQMATDTRVFLFANEDVDPSITPGNCLPLDRFRHAFHCTIPAGQLAPSTAIGNREWTVALPVSMRSADLGIIGEPLVRSPLISELYINPLPPRVEVYWKWLGPRQWISTRLEWFFYDENQQVLEEDPDEPNLREVLWQEFERFNTIELLNYITCRNERGFDLRGWNICISATPLLFGKELAGSSRLENYTDL